jgi:hypothetical protein
MAEYIEREALIAKFKQMELGEHGLVERLFADGVYAVIAAFPSADVAPVVHGRWEQDADGDWYCTNCDEVVAICESGRERTYRKPYCPNCGAKMDGGSDHLLQTVFFG